MELLVFDLDGTLLNAEQQITEYTSETLRLLTANDIPYTLATGRTIHAATSAESILISLLIRSAFLASHLKRCIRVPRLLISTHLD